MMSNRASILVIEDDPDIRASLRECLELEGYRIQEAPNGREGLALLEAGQRPGLILLDLMMPIMGGKQFLEETAPNPEFVAIPVLLLSAAADAPQSQSIARVLKKPIDLDQLIEAVREFASESTRD